MSFVRRFRLPVFWISLTLIAVTLSVCVHYSAAIDGFFQAAQDSVTHYTGWFMILVINVVLGFIVYLGFSRHRHYRIGGEDAQPEFSLLAWLGMLFAAGMGIGLLFYSVAEPLAHYEAFLPHLNDRKAETARMAMNMTFLHWGFHPWAVYALVGLSLAWFHFSKAQPLSFLGPLAATTSPNRAKYGGMALNVFAILGTVFGVSTSLGLGTSQASAGIEMLTGWEKDLQMQMILIIIVSLIAFVSVISGVGNGIRIISQTNLVAAVFLMLFVLFAGETVFALKAMGQHMGFYLNNFIESSSWRETYTGTNWQAQWTLFYWAWWISWSPFVGLFIARISYGRKVGEFIAGVLIVPAIFNFIWMSVFGSNALHDILFGEAMLLGADSDTSLFILLESLPFATFTIGLATIIVLLFFVTSADSGALVTATLASGGDEPPLWQRAFWSLMVLCVTALLLNAGGLEALQTATILTGLPFAIVLLVLGWALHKNFRHHAASHSHAEPV
mgnify:CR=1 FL=1